MHLSDSEATVMLLICMHATSTVSVVCWQITFYFFSQSVANCVFVEEAATQVHKGVCKQAS